MQSAVTIREIERYSVGVEKKFTINATGVAFKILSSQLYRDKIEAIVRELSTNAYDGHVAGGCTEKPFRVHLPNALEPFFSVRDDGIGMSHADMLDIYQTYFASTKGHSNDYVGALGLGCKSPFSYVDSFTVISRFDGTARTYAAFIDENSEPALTLMSEVPTAECAGMEVKLPVKHHTDFAEFRHRAEKVLSWFSVRPVVVGCPEFAFKETGKLVSGNGWYLAELSTRNSYALMGQVAYPVLPYSTSTMSPLALRLYQTSIVIEFPIGALDVTAGREDLSYDKPTLAALEARAQAIISEAPAVFQAAFDACGSELEARKLYSKLFYGGTDGIRIWNDFETVGVFYKGKKITSGNFNVHMEGFPGIFVEDIRPGKRRRTCYKYGKNGIGLMSVNTTEKVIFVVNDMVYGSTVRINHHRASHPHVSLVVITADAGSDLDGFKAVFDGCEFGLVSDLQKPASRRVAQKVMPVKLFSPSICRIGACSDLDWRDDDDDVMIDPSAGGIYLLRKDINGVFDGSKDVKFYTVLRYARQAGILDLVKTPVYGLTKAAERAFLAAGHPWRNVADVVMEAAKKEMGDPKMQFAMAAQEEILALHAPCYGLLRCRDSLAQLAGCLSEGHPLRTFGIEYNIAWGKQNSEEVNSLAHLCKSLGMAFRRDKSETLLSQWESLERSYPMLCSLRHSVVAVKHLSDYVCWVDEQQRHVPAVQAA